MIPEPLRFAVLGPLRVVREGAELSPGSPQERALLALLLARAGEPVPVAEIVEALWGPCPPQSAVNVTRRHVGTLRRLLEPDLPARASGHWLLRNAGGYRLRTDAGSLDLLRFRELRERARQATAQGTPAPAVELLVEALSLWRGPVAADIPELARAHTAFRSLTHERAAAAQEAADAALSAGVPGSVLPELRRAAVDHPLDEPLLARLILLLAACGLRTEAVQTYERTRTLLADALGIDPGPELRAAGERARHGLAPPRGGTPGQRPETEAEPAGASGPPAATLPVPSQLPPGLAAFTGRRAELDEILAPLADGAVAAGTVVITAIDGMAGIGKTTLAVHWAHQVADRFPDGQLYVNLRGFDPSGAVTSPGEAVRGFLAALGVPPERVPLGVDAQVALYRSMLAGRRFLVLLDNARDTEQVRQLLPGGPGCLAIVTSRSRLSGLVATQGAHSLTLHPFDDDQARDFLARRIGAERTAAEPQAVREITALCGGLPLALACVAARASAHPGFPLAALAAELREAHGSLDAFARNDTSADVAAVFSWSSRALSPAASRLFRLLALHPGPDFSAPAAAALAALPVRATRPLLSELASAHLLGEHVPGRHAFHDLVRAHATELVHAQEPRAEREAAVHRLFAYCQRTAHAAALLLAPNEDPTEPEPVPAGVVPERFDDDGEALNWLTAEYPVLLAVIDAAAASGREGLACLLAWALEPFFDRRGHWQDGVLAQRTALAAALRTADPAWEARARLALARAEGRLGLHRASRTGLEHALELFTALGDGTGRADTHRSLGWVSEQEGDLPDALRHNQLALSLFRACGNRAAQAGVLNSVGWYHALLGQHRQALDHCFEALTMLQDLGDRYGQATTWHSIAYAYQQLGRHPHALLGYRNALALYRELGVPYMEADTLGRIGDTHLSMGNHEEAATAWQDALALLTELGHPDADQVRARLDPATVTAVSPERRSRRSRASARRGRDRPAG